MLELTIGIIQINTLQLFYICDYEDMGDLFVDDIFAYHVYAEKLCIKFHGFQYSKGSIVVFNTYEDARDALELVEKFIVMWTLLKSN